MPENMIIVTDQDTLALLYNISNDEAYLEKKNDPDTILRYILVGGIWYWIPDVEYTKA